MLIYEYILIFAHIRTEFNMRYSKTNLTKIELILKSQGYSIRYEKGNFVPAYCLLNNKKVVVINKFLDLRQRIDSFCHIAAEIKHIDYTLFSSEDLDFWNQVTNKSSELKLVA